MPTKSYFETVNGVLLQRNEYDGQVDFNLSAKHTNWRIQTIIGINRVSKFSQDLMDRTVLFNLRMMTRPLGNPLSHMALGFAPRFISLEGNKAGRRKLLKYLQGEKYIIIWKEDGHGYEITSSGHIRRKWTLDKQPPPLPFVMPPFKPIIPSSQLALPLNALHGPRRPIPLIPDCIV